MTRQAMKCVHGLAERLWALRIVHGLSQHRMAERLSDSRAETFPNDPVAADFSVWQTSVSDWENSAYAPSAHALITVAQSFSVSIDWLLMGANPPEWWEPSGGLDAVHRAWTEHTKPLDRAKYFRDCWHRASITAGDRPLP